MSDKITTREILMMLIKCFRTSRIHSSCCEVDINNKSQPSTPEIKNIDV